MHYANMTQNRLKSIWKSWNQFFTQCFLHLILFMITSIYVPSSARHLQLFYASKNSLKLNEILIHLFNSSLMTQFNLLLIIYYCNFLYPKQIPFTRMLLFHYLSLMISYTRLLFYIYYFIAIQSLSMNLYSLAHMIHSLMIEYYSECYKHYLWQILIQKILVIISFIKK